MLTIVFAILSFINIEDKKYPASEIPEELKKKADIVYRLDQAEFSIEAQNKATYHVHQVITIFNKNGDDRAEVYVFYDKLRKINLMKAAIYDAMGTLIRKLRNGDIKDQSAVSQGSLFEDDRLKYANLTQNQYPYTIDFEYEVEYGFLFYIPTWRITPGERASVEQSSFTLSYPPSLRPHHKLLNSTIQPIKEINEGRESLTWLAKNMSSVKEESFSPSSRELYSIILIAPSQFQYENYIGTMNTWEEFGNWQKTLLTGRDVLPPSLKDKVAMLIAGKKTNEEKARVLYEYLQSKTRYISIQLGIGGWQPFEAATVDKTGYGDCKALSNYMVAMLHEAKVPAYYTLIKAGRKEEDIIADFPSNQFNHVIAAVPNGKDTLWLECTSQTNPFGYLGGFTGNRHALMITEKGGVLVKTPSYPAEINTQVINAIVKIDATGNATAKIAATYSGLQYENGGLQFIINNSYEDQQKWIQENTNIPGFDITSFSMVNQKGKIPSAVVNEDLALKRYATVTGKRMFVTPNLMNQSSFVPEKTENRKHDIIRKIAYTDYDTIHYQFPESLYPEFLPEPTKINSIFGEYEVKFVFDAGQITYMRKMKVVDGRFPKQNYNELVDFYKAINKADHIKLVFLNKT